MNRHIFRNWPVVYGNGDVSISADGVPTHEHGPPARGAFPDQQGGSRS